ncbi:MAG TPA: transcriptional repressor LexA [Planctomycetota bacterium]|nr:transcriptional repressor LexA [Planctomycetota bacterium]
MTPRQFEVLRFIEDYAARKGCSPTLQEMADHLRLSKVTVLGHLRRLEKSRHIRRGYYRRRGIEVLIPSRRLPVVGRIAAGRPVEAIAQPEELDLAGLLRRGREYFALQVRGDSMIGDHICDGDFVIVERRSDVRDGEMVVALLDGREATLKRYYREGRGVRLQPSNPSVDPLFVDRPERLKIQGVVVGVLRRM